MKKQDILVKFFEAIGWEDFQIYYDRNPDDKPAGWYVKTEFLKDGFLGSDFDDAVEMVSNRYNDLYYMQIAYSIRKQDGGNTKNLFSIDDTIDDIFEWQAIDDEWDIDRGVDYPIISLAITFFVVFVILLLYIL